MTRALIFIGFVLFCLLGYQVLSDRVRGTDQRQSLFGARVLDKPDSKCLAWNKKKLPSCFPSNLPVPPDMQISSSEGNPHTGSYMVQGKTETSIAKVFASYRQRTANLGWEEIGYERSRANKMVKATYRNKFDYFELSLSPLAGGTMVTIETFKEAQ